MAFRACCVNIVPILFRCRKSANKISFSYRTGIILIFDEILLGLATLRQVTKDAFSNKGVSSIKDSSLVF